MDSYKAQLGLVAASSLYLPQRSAEKPARPHARAGVTGTSCLMHADDVAPSISVAWATGRSATLETLRVRTVLSAPGQPVWSPAHAQWELLSCPDLGKRGE